MSLSQVVVSHPAWNMPEAHRFSISKGIRDLVQTQFKMQILVLVKRFEFKYFSLFKQEMFTLFMKLAKLQMKVGGLLFSLASWLL